MLAEATELIRLLLTGEQVTYHGEFFDADQARIWDVPDRPVELALAVGGSDAVDRFAPLADHLIATEPEAALLRQWDEVKGAGTGSSRKIGQIPISWDRDRSRAVERAHRLFRWFGGGWAVNADLPVPNGFEGATQFVTPDDVADAIPCGPDVDAIVDAVREYEKAGFTDVAVVADRRRAADGVPHRPGRRTARAPPLLAGAAAGGVVVVVPVGPVVPVVVVVPVVGVEVVGVLVVGADVVGVVGGPLVVGGANVTGAGRFVPFSPPGVGNGTTGLSASALHVRGPGLGRLARRRRRTAAGTRPAPRCRCRGCTSTAVASCGVYPTNHDDDTCSAGPHGRGGRGAGLAGGRPPERGGVRCPVPDIDDRLEGA